MGLKERIGKGMLTIGLLGAIPLNYTHGFTPAYESLSEGVSREEHEIQLHAEMKRDYCDTTTNRCDPRVLTDFVTIPGRVTAYVLHPMIE